MPPQPTLEMYMQRHADYQQFVALALILGAGVAWLFVRSGGGCGLRWRPSMPLILLLGAALRLPLMTQDFWYDETFTSLVVGGSWAQLWSVVSGDVHPPLYYAIVKLFADVFGHNDIVMRLPALLSGLATIYVFDRIGAAHGGISVGRWSAALVAVWPAAVYYSAEARYPMFLALALAVAYLGIRRKHWWLASAALAVAGGTHVNAWFYVVLLCAVMPRRLLPSALPSLPVLAWLPFAAKQAGDVADGFWLQQSNVARFLVDMTITARMNDYPFALVLAVVAVSTGILFAAMWRWRSSASWLWIIAFAVPALAQWLVGAVWHPIYLERTLLFSALLLAVPMGAWINRHAQRLQAVAGALAVALVVVSIWTYDRSKADDALAHCADATLVYAPTTYSAIVASHYADAAVVVTAPDGNNTSQSLPDDVRRRLWLMVPAAPDGACVFAQVDSFTTERQVTQINELVSSPAIESVSRFSYFVVE